MRSRVIGILLALVGAVVIVLAPAAPFILDDPNLEGFFAVHKGPYRHMAFASLAPAIPGILVVVTALVALVTPRWPHWRWLFGMTGGLAIAASLAAFGLAQGYQARPQMYDSVMVAVVTLTVGALMIVVGAVLMPRSDTIGMSTMASPATT
jgi:hypothetical protein